MADTVAARPATKRPRATMMQRDLSSSMLISRRRVIDTDLSIVSTLVA